MANPSVTHTFSNGTTADATQVNTNFTDLINGMTDGTKSFTIDALTVGGAATFNGAVTLGNGTPDDITFTGSLASSIPIKTTFSYDVGVSTIGLKSIYLGSSDSAAKTVRIISGAVGTSYTITLPTGVPAQSNSVATFTDAGVASFEPKSKRAVVSKTTTYTATAADDTILVSGSGGAWTLTLPAAASNTGKTYFIKRTDNTPANAVTIDGNGSETIDGATTRALYTQYESITIQCDGSNWVILDHKCDTPWTSYTPTFANMGTVSNIEMWWRRQGADVVIRGVFTVGTGAASVATMTMPTGVAIDTAVLSATNILCGSGSTQTNGSFSLTVLMSSGSSTTVSFGLGVAGSFANGNSRNGDSFGAGEVDSINLKVPVSGWFA